MTSSLPPVRPVDRQLGAAVRLAGVIGPLWLPLVAWAVLRPVSSFAAAHAWHEFRDGLVWKGILLVVMVVSLILTLVRLNFHIASNWTQFSWGELLIRAGLTVLVLGTLFVVNLFQAVFQARRAYQGQWPMAGRPL